MSLQRHRQPTGRRLVAVLLTAAVLAITWAWMSSQDPRLSRLERWPWLEGRCAPYFDHAALAMAEHEIRGARRSIDLEMFMLGGAFGERILKLLDEKTRQGVRVRLIHEEGRAIQLGVRLKRILISSGILPASLASASHEPVAERLFSGELRASAIERAAFPLHRFPVSRLSSPLRNAHDKLLVIDGCIAILGGMNFSSAVANNHDCLLRITGPAVQAPAAVFAYDWAIAVGREVEFPLAPRATRSRRDADQFEDRLSFAVTRPPGENQLEPLLDLIAGAGTRIWVQMFYVTHPRIIKALGLAAARGVDVRVLVDSNEYSLGLPMHGAPNLAFLDEFAELGVALRMFRSAPGSQMHQKSILIDSEMVFSGATNLTVQSFVANTESAFFIRSRRLGDEFARRFASDWAERSDPPDRNRFRNRSLFLSMVRWLSRYI